MRGIITISGFLVALAFMILICTSVLSADVRRDEVNQSLKRAVDESMMSMLNDNMLNEISGITTKNQLYYTEDGKFEILQNNYSDFIIVDTAEDSKKYWGICYNPEEIIFTKEQDSIWIKATNLCDIGYFEMDPDYVKDIYTADRIILSENEMFMHINTMLCASSNIYSQSEELLIEKNLFTNKEMAFLNTFCATLVKRIGTDGEITVTVMGIDYENGFVDVLIEEIFKYANAKQDSSMYRKSVIFDKR